MASNEEEKLRIGFYKMKDEELPVRYVFVSKSFMNKPNFLSEAFVALGIPSALNGKVKAIPNLMFDIESTEDLEDWNMRLPLDKSNLCGADHEYAKNSAVDRDGDGKVEKSEMKVVKEHPGLKQHQGVIESACRRLLKGISQGAMESGAVFKVDSVFDSIDGRDQITEWIEATNIPVPVFAVADKKAFTSEIYEQMMNSVQVYDEVKHNPNNDPEGFFEIDPMPWYNNVKKVEFDADGNVYNSIPHNNITHLFITNDLYRLEKEIENQIPQGNVLIHGSEGATKKMCEAIQSKKPCFVFKYTGSTADFLCETLAKANDMIRLRRFNPNERVNPPFDLERMKQKGSHSFDPKYLWNFEDDDIATCRLLNIFFDNFPEDFNPATVVQIDLFNTTEKKLQEQLMKAVKHNRKVKDEDQSVDKQKDGSKNENSTEVKNVENTEEGDGKKKKETKRLTVGYYKMKDETNLVKYVYVSDKYMNRPNFLDDIFVALDIPNSLRGTVTTTPNLIFDVESTCDVEDWNVRLPPFKSDLCNKDHIYDRNTVNEEGNIVMEKSEMRVIEHYSPLRHYQGVIESNCRRLLKGTAMACMQAGAIFQVDPCFDHIDGRDQITEWIESSGVPVPVLGVAGKGAFYKKLYDRLKANAKEYDPDDSDIEEDEHFTPVEIDPSKYYSGELKPRVVGESSEIQDSIPHNNLTHLIITNNIYRLKREMKKVIPTGLLLLHGSVSSTKYFCEAIQNGEPVFIFKYTGSTADLACEALASVDKMLRLKRLNRKERPEQPFQHDMKPEFYRHPGWLWPFSKDDVEVCRLLNILVENFPDRYDPSSVLQIDMFNTSEEKLQDQLTKTMSVVFEGVGELGGQAAEDRRLTYAWRLRHLLLYNSTRHRFRADVLQFLIILFTLFSVAAAVLFNYFQLIRTCPVTDDNFADFPLSLQVLSRLCLILPLIATVLRGMNAALNPTVKSSILKLGAIRVENEIYMYRTKVGQYSVRKITMTAPDKKKKGKDKKDKKDADKDDKDSKQTNPRKAFGNALDTLWTDLAASDINKGGLISPSIDESPLKDINDRIITYAKAQDYFLATIRHIGGKNDKIKEMDEERLKLDIKRTELRKTVEKTRSRNNSSRSRFSFSSNSGQKNNNLAQRTDISPNSPSRFNIASNEDTDDFDPNEANFGSVPNQNNPMLSRVVRSNSTLEQIGNRIENGISGAAEDLVDGVEVVGNTFKNNFGYEDEMDIMNKLSEEIMLDDGLATLTADEYVKVRVIPVLAEFTSQAPLFSRSVTVVTAIVISLSITSAIFSAFSLTTFIPLALAFGEALTSWQAHNSTEIRLMQTNGAMNQLHKLLIWWDSLSMIEKRVATNKEMLVQVTEAAVQGQVMNYSGNGERDDRQDGSDDDS